MKICTTLFGKLEVNPELVRKAFLIVCSNTSFTSLSMHLLTYIPSIGMPPSDTGVFHMLWHWHMSSKKYDPNNWESYVPPVTDYQTNVRSVYDILKDMQKLVNERNHLLDMRKRDFGLTAAATVEKWNHKKRWLVNRKLYGGFIRTNPSDFADAVSDREEYLKGDDPRAGHLATSLSVNYDWLRRLVERSQVDYSSIAKTHGDWNVTNTLLNYFDLMFGDPSTVFNTGLQHERFLKYEPFMS